MNLTIDEKLDDSSMSLSALNRRINPQNADTMFKTKLEMLSKIGVKGLLVDITHFIA